MNRLLLLSGVAATSLTALASAQSTITTSPAGFETTAAAGTATSSAVRPFFGAAYRNQQIDHTIALQQNGTPITNIFALQLRRNETEASPDVSAVARTADIEIKMGHGDTDNAHNFYANNYVAPPTTVYTLKSTSLPDMQVSSTLSPEPWGVLRIVLDTPFTYNGTDDLIIETIYQNTTDTGNYAFDAINDSANPDAYELLFNVRAGVGCVAYDSTGNPRPSTFRYSVSPLTFALSSMQTMMVRFRPIDGPANSPLLTLLDAVDQPGGIAFPGLCGPVYVLPTVTMFHGVLNSAGTWSGEPNGDVYFRFPYIPALIGGTMYQQMLGIDPFQAGIKLALSDYTSIGFPAAIPTTPSWSVVYNGNDIANPYGGIFHSRAAIYGLEH